MSGQGLIALLKFWPDVLPGVVAAVARPRPATPGPYAVRVLGHALPGGTAFDIAFEIEGPGPGDRAGALALELADAVSSGRLFEGPGGLWFSPRGAVPAEGRMLEPLPADVGAQLVRASDGWNLLGAPDRETFRTISMTFLRKRFYDRYDEHSAWRAAEVNELASLVIGTHRAEDVEGTSETYGIPCLCLASWLDEAQADEAGGSLEGTRSSLLAARVQYGALLAGEGEPGDELALRRRLRRLFGGAAVPES